MSILSFRNVKKVYLSGEVTVNALSDISFDIPEGELVVILGPSGSGKSTILNIAGGMDRVTEGTVLFDGKDVSSFSDRELTMYRRENIGFVFQFYNLIPSLTALENVEIVARLCKDSMNIDMVMEDVDLKDKQHNFPSQLSGGEQQRVAIARAVAKNPRLLLCDEPTGALDYATGKRILSLLYSLNKSMKKTVILITHNSAVAGIAHRIIKIRSGEVEKDEINPNPVSPERIEW